jgi:hypothetical protein
MKGEPRGAKWKSVYFETVCYLWIHLCRLT